MYVVKKCLSIVLLSVCLVTVLYGNAQNAERIFTTIFQQNLWLDKESVSGGGSNIRATNRIREGLPRLLKDYSIKSLLDVPCGDFNWLKTIDLSSVRYIGADIVKALVDKNNKLYANDMRSFMCVNAITDVLPTVDLILCRDMFVHFDFATIRATLRNFKKSGSRYLLVTVQPHVIRNQDIKMGQWRPLNLEKAPFNFPKPLVLLPDRENEWDNGSSKYLGLWRLEDIPA